MLMTFVVSFAIVFTVPPLTEEQVIRLETAADGRSVREEAFFALVENARLWSGEVGDVPVRMKLSFDAMLAAPESYRGDLCMIEGQLSQQATLEPPYDVAVEWFVRDTDGRPIAVYVVGLDAEDLAHFHDGDRVRIYARFYKRVDDVGRDNVTRSYPAFVGAHPQRIGPQQDQGLAALWIVLLPLMILLGVFAILFAYIRSQKRRDRERPRRMLHTDIPDDVMSLPDDPAEALVELEQRHREADGDS